MMRGLAREESVTSIRWILMIILLPNLVEVVLSSPFQFVLLNVYLAKISRVKLNIQFSVRQSATFSHSCMTLVVFLQVE
jgi:hypothetical protein